MHNKFVNSNTENHKAVSDLAEQLAALIDAGWNEGDIVRFARLRVNYARGEYDAIASPSSGNFSGYAHLSFVRWLYHNQRLFS